MNKPRCLSMFDEHLLHYEHYAINSDDTSSSCSNFGLETQWLNSFRLQTRTKL